MKKRLMSVLLACLLVFTAFSAAMAEAITIAEIQKYGNLILTVPAADFLREGYTYGDIVAVSIGENVYDMPVGTSYSDVDEGSMVCRVLPEEDLVILAVNMGDLATHSGIAVKTKIEEDPGYRWDYTSETPVAISFAMKEPAGYLGEFLLRQLQRTNERADYAHLTDAAFANFRSVATTGMGENVLYRSSSPLNPEIGRHLQADAALGEAGVRTIINLADTLEGVQSYESYPGSAYSACTVIALNLGVDFTAPDFQSGLADGLHFLAQHEGPYLVHCNEGKDRAGFVSALLSCLMGASGDEVLADYMITYYNYYGVEPDSDRYDAIAERNIAKTLADAFAIESIHEADLAAEAEAYLQEVLGIDPATIAQIKQNLAGK